MKRRLLYGYVWATCVSLTLMTSSQNSKKKCYDDVVFCVAVDKREEVVFLFADETLTKEVTSTVSLSMLLKCNLLFSINIHKNNSINLRSQKYDFIYGIEHSESVEDSR